MAAAAKKDNMFVCAICLSDMLDRSPKALQCLHTFCAKCLKALPKQADAIKCPTCRHETTLPIEGVDHLPDNFHLKSFKDSLASMSSKKSAGNTCTVCAESAKEVPSQYTCLECGMRLCRSCKTIHQQRFKKDPHLLLEGADVSVSSQCRIHTSAVATFFCIQCDELLCTVCAFQEKHESHDNAESHLGSRCLKMIARLSKCEKYIDECDTTMENILTEYQIVQSTQASIRQVGQDLKADIDQQVQNLVQEVEGKFGGPMMDLMAMVAKRRQSLTHLAEIVDKLTARHISNEKYASIYIWLQKTLDDLNIDGKQINASQVIVPTFEKNNVYIGKLNSTSCKQFRGSLSMIKTQDLVEEEELALDNQPAAEYVAVSPSGQSVYSFNNILRRYDIERKVWTSSAVFKNTKIKVLFFQGADLHAVGDAVMCNVDKSITTYHSFVSLRDSRIQNNEVWWYLTDGFLYNEQESVKIKTDRPTCLAAVDSGVAVADNSGKIIRLCNVIDMSQQLTCFNMGQVDYNALFPEGFVQSMQHFENNQLLVLDGHLRNINHITLDGKILARNIVPSAYGPVIAFSYSQPHLLAAFNEKLVRFRYHAASS